MNGGFYDEDPSNLSRITPDLSYFDDIEKYLQILRDNDNEEQFVCISSNLVSEIGLEDNKNLPSQVAITSRVELVKRNKRKAKPTKIVTVLQEAAPNTPLDSTSKDQVETVKVPKRSSETEKQTNAQCKSGVQVSNTEKVDNSVRYCRRCPKLQTEHYHCYEKTCKKLKIFPKEQLQRHLNFHQKKQSWRERGFIRFSSYESCASVQRGCPHSHCKTHYHCIRPNCERVCLGLGDAEAHQKHHLRSEQTQTDGFVRFSRSENCRDPLCQFFRGKTTHFHCLREGCTFAFKDKTLLKPHKLLHSKNDQFQDLGCKKFSKHNSCGFMNCNYSQNLNHFHCLIKGCDFTAVCTSKAESHKVHHEKLRKLISKGVKVTEYKTAKLSAKECMELFDKTVPHNPERRSRRRSVKPALNDSNEDVISDFMTNIEQSVLKMEEQEAKQQNLIKINPIDPTKSSFDKTTRDVKLKSSDMNKIEPQPDLNYSFYLRQTCPSIECALFRNKHFHCGEVGCCYVTKSEQNIIAHSARHRNRAQKVAQGFQQFTRYEDCSMPGCRYNRNTAHFHCRLCEYTFCNSAITSTHMSKHTRKANGSEDSMKIKMVWQDGGWQKS